MKIINIILFFCLLSTAVYAQRTTAEKYKEMGTEMARQGNFNEALKHLNQAIEIDPTYDAAYNNRGNVKLGIGKYYEAIDDFTKAININSNDAAYFYNRAQAHLKLEHKTEALSDITKAIETSPGELKYYEAAATLYQEIGNINKAVEIYSKALKHDASNAQLYYKRGVLKMSTTNYLDGHRDIYKAADLGYFKAKDIVSDVFFNAIPDDDILALSTRGSMKYYFKDYQSAIDDFDLLLKKDSKNPKAYLYKGLAQIRLNNIEQGCSNLRKSKKLGEQQAEAEITRYCK